MKYFKRWFAPLAVIVAFCGLSASSQGPAVVPDPSTPYPLSIIVVRTREEAEQILERVKHGELFSALAFERSISPTASSGGYLGMMAVDQLRPALRQAMNGVGFGQCSSIAQVPEGYAILYLMSAPPEEGPAGMNASRISAAEVKANVKFLPEVSGLDEMMSALVAYHKQPGWNEDPQSVCRDTEESTSQYAQAMARQLAPDSEETANDSPAQLLDAHNRLAEVYAGLGDMNRAIAQFQIMDRIAREKMPQGIPLLDLLLGTAYYHKSEMENGVFRHPGDLSIFPPQPGVAYAHQEDSEKAVQYFTDYLRRNPDRLDVKWVLNLAYATMGKYPDGVPKQYLIPPHYFASPEEVGRFVDVAREAGIDDYQGAGGIIVDDFENNGLLDIVTSDRVDCGHLRYYHNNGDGTFTDRSEQSGLSRVLGGTNLLQADYNNDGCPDILVLRGGWTLPQRMSLLRNNCHGVFTDVTEASGLTQPVSSMTAAWADINNDGLLDLFVGNEQGPSHLYLNLGNGKFKDISRSAGIDKKIATTKAVVAADYDHDGYVDFYLSNLTGPDFLYHNNHNDTFTEVAKQAGVEDARGRKFPAWFFDYDNDGWPDLFVASYSVSVDETLRTYLGLPHDVNTLRLYRNLGNGTFADVTSQVGLDRVYMPMGANFGDIDNDGYLDIYLGTGNPSYNSELPHVLLRNDAGKRFVDVTASSGTGELHKGHGVAFADLDRRGYEDLLEVVGGAVPGDRSAFRLFENPGNNNKWINLKLVGVKTNRSAIGARIEVTVETETGGTQSFYRTVGSGGSFGASPLEQNIGLGNARRIRTIAVDWPVSHTRQVFHKVRMDQFLEIREFAKNYVKLDRPAVRLGGAKRSGAANSAPASHRKALSAP